MEKFKKISNQMISVLVASAIGAFSVEAVMIPNGLTTGGITGIGRIIQNYTTVSYSTIYYGLSFIVLIIVALTLGWKELGKIIALSISVPTMMYIFEQLNIKLLESDDLFLSAIFSGVLTGISCGIMFYGGLSSGGTDSIAKVIKKKLYPQIPLSKIMFLIDASIIAISALVFGTNIALYALITEFIIMRVIDTVMYGFASKIVKMDIITADPDGLTDYVIHEIGRGVTSVDTVGEYTKVHKKQLVILCSPNESLKIRRKLAKEDPTSFVSLIQVNSVWGLGRGFDNIDSID